MAKEPRTVLPGMMMGSEGEVDCGLVFASESIILAFLAIPTFAQVLLGGRPATGKDFHIMQMAWSKRDRESPDEILKSNKRNFLLPYSKITKVEVSKRLLRSCRLNLNTVDAVHRFKFHGVGADEIQRTVRSILPEAIPVTRVERLD